MPPIKKIMLRTFIFMSYSFSAIGELGDSEAGQPGTQSLKIRICLPPKTISPALVQPDPHSFAFKPIQSPPSETPQMSTQNSPNHLEETADPQISIEPSPFEDIGGSEKPSTLWNVSSSSQSSKRLTLSSNEEQTHDKPELSTTKPSIYGMRIPRIRRDIPNESISPVVMLNKSDAFPEKKKSEPEHPTAQLDNVVQVNKPAQQTVNSPRTRSGTMGI